MLTSSRSVRLGSAAALGAAVLFGINGSVAKVVVGAGITAPQLTFLRLAATVLIAGTVVAITMPRCFRITRRELGHMAALGIGGLAMIQWLYTVAITQLQVGVGLLFQYTAVILVALTAWLVFKEEVHRRLWWAIAAVLVGLTLVAQVWQASLNVLGVVAALASAVAYAFYFLAGEKGAARMPPLAVLFWASLFAAAFWGVFSAWWRIDWSALASPTSLTGALAYLTPPAWAPLLWVMTLGGFAPFFLSITALRHLSATATGILATFEVVVAFAVAWVWLGEALLPVQVVGAAVVMAGLVIAQTARHAPPVPDGEATEA